MADDVLLGAAKIADHLKIDRRQVYALVNRGRLPVWRENSLILSTRTLIDEWVSERKNEARAHFRERQLEHA